MAASPNGARCSASHPSRASRGAYTVCSVSRPRFERVRSSSTPLAARNGRTLAVGRGPVLAYGAMSRWKRLGSAFTVAAAIGLATSVALGQSDIERAGARSAAEAGVQAYRDGKYQEALDLFKRAESLFHAPPHLLYIARAEEKLGHLVAAKEAYNKIVREPLAASAPPAFASARKDAETELAALGPRVPVMTVLVTGNGANGAVVTVDGTELPKALVGIPFPIDPGEHSFQAKAGNAASEVVTQTVAERSTGTVSLELVGDPGVALTPPPASPAPGAASAPPPPPPSAPEADRGVQASKLPAYVAFGVGGAGVIAGTVFLILRGSKQSDADALFDECTRRVCSSGERADFVDMDRAAARYGTLTWVGYGVGAAGIGAGVALLVLGQGADPEKAEGSFVRPFLGVTQAGLYGRF
jgi:hypothetical protein